MFYCCIVLLFSSFYSWMMYYDGYTNISLPSARQEHLLDVRKEHLPRDRENALPKPAVWSHRHCHDVLCEYLQDIRREYTGEVLCEHWHKVILLLYMYIYIYIYISYIYTYIIYIYIYISCFELSIVYTYKYIYIYVYIYIYTYISFRYLPIINPNKLSLTFVV